MTYPRRPTRGELLEEARGHLLVLHTMLKALGWKGEASNAAQWIESYDLHHRTKVTKTIARTKRRCERRGT